MAQLEKKKDNFFNCNYWLKSGEDPYKVTNFLHKKIIINTTFIV